MNLDFIPLDKLSVSPTNMRHGKKPPDVSDILPSVRKRGVLVPVLVRPDGARDRFEIVAGRRRFTAASVVADERREAGEDATPLPCAILDESDDADAVEASLIENVARRDPDEVTQWATFTRLVKEGRSVDDIAATFGLPELAVKRILALGNLLPRIRSLYAGGDIDAATVRHLTLASKRQQQAWLALADDADAYCPTGHQHKGWLFGGQSINRRTLDELRKLHRNALDPKPLGRMIALIENEQGFPLYDAVGKLKRELSSADEATFLFSGGRIELSADVQRSEFEDWIASDLRRIEAAMDDALAKAGVTPSGIDQVFLTGGSSLIPAIRSLFDRRFGHDKIATGGELTSIAHGLALIGCEDHFDQWTV
ncbi:MAG: ParB/RepB/Spo0J family partition protein [Sphingomonas sp.]